VDELCDQDQTILRLVNGHPVRLNGNHRGFDQFITQDQDSNFALVLLTDPAWISEIFQQLDDWIDDKIDFVYIGINRYCILGNDTITEYHDNGIGRGQQLVNVLRDFLLGKGLVMKTSGTFDDDLGRYFNFVQPLTWIYCERETDRSH
jgi:hypothetical protein